MISRPSKKECEKRLGKAKQAVIDGQYEIENLFAFVCDIDEFGYIVSDLERVLPVLFDEIGYRHYAGQRPPTKSYKSQIEGAELWAFSWNSKLLGCKTYLKFALKNDKMWIVSLHKSRHR